MATRKTTVKKSKPTAASSVVTKQSVNERLAVELVEARLAVAAAREREKAILAKLGSRLLSDRYATEDSTTGRPGHTMVIELVDGTTVRGTHVYREAWDTKKMRAFLTSAQLRKCRKPDVSIVRFYTPGSKDADSDE